MYWGDCFL